MGLIAADGLSIGHGKRRIASGINLGLDPGEILCLLGPNGAGKTTLFRTLLGLTPALGGTIYLDGQSLPHLGRAQIARSVAYVPQSLNVPFPYSVRDLVLMGRTSLMGAFARPSPRDKILAEEVLDTIGIRHLGDMPVTAISGGERQLALIARALAQQSRAIILDEPAASLDFGNRERLLDMLTRLAADGLGLIVSTHEPSHAARIAQRVLSIDRQGSTQCGPTREALTAHRLAQLYDIAPSAVGRAAAEWVTPV